jgi:hypothetical protein
MAVWGWEQAFIEFTWNFTNWLFLFHGLCSLVSSSDHGLNFGGTETSLELGFISAFHLAHFVGLTHFCILHHPG